MKGKYLLPFIGIYYNLQDLFKIETHDDLKDFDFIRFFGCAAYQGLIIGLLHCLI